ncbi:MAG: Asp-tRNA(Asn)/Glu-tRNA(Gln) amidotransferase subunit GatB [Thiofilum sp.]|uniref:Asp-tRNA(Asn)/Glu-tRNA(Gln) amidotransferase subunit GatB n=1 Tax=Thiofilum sp. TaxID=2212733 RepID=UPI0025F67DEE|nr:Asp-tRNA(Asn)/Glu-tRNA(Gln) amidotransferase subunit GatB [Thiofilum sp.]MBK8453015.1 Asp-tRNA(Asn)/Glu-tRNA(Gln) amidotransferase subunit GatB [Thiofilum sp.]
MEWETVIGLEIHAQLATQSKIFSGSSTAYGAEPNTQANLVDLAMPGVLPVLNKKAVEFGIKLGLALDAEIGKRSVFARKNYFYPDLPKGYQISQYELPIVGKGHLDIELEDGTVKRIGITRAHLEEDAGKSVHEGFVNQSGIDLNRASTPLLEIVSEPDIRSAKEAVAYVKKMHSLVRYLRICDGNMQEGSFRCDVNVSVHKPNTPFGTRVEIKNLNSFRFIERAIYHEVARHIDLIEAGKGHLIVQETRLFDPDKDETRSMRSKEDANDYRYFPDPDLLPVIVTEADIEAARANLPELPDAKKARFMSEYGLSAYDAGLLVQSREEGEYFEAVAKSTGDAKLAANWMNVELAARLNRAGLGFEQLPIKADDLMGLLKRIQDNTISNKMAKDVLDAMWEGEGTADSIIAAKGLVQITDTGALEAIIDEIIAANPKQVAEYRSGKEKMFGFFVGQAMKASKGKANPATLNDLLKQKLAG